MWDHMTSNFLVQASLLPQLLGKLELQQALPHRAWGTPTFYSTVSKTPWPWPGGISQLCNAAQQTNSFSPGRCSLSPEEFILQTLLKKRNQIESCQLWLQDVRSELGHWRPAICTCLLDVSGPSLAFSMQHTHIFLSLSLRIAFWLHTATV